MRRLITIALVSIAGILAGYAESRNEIILRQLDDAIANKSTFQKNKEQYLDNLKKMIDNCKVLEQKYGIYSNLYDGYSGYSTDSALVYGLKKYDLAVQIGRQEWVNASRLDIINLYYMAGMWTETLSMMDSIDKSTLYPNDMARYYHIYRSTYESLSRNCISPQISEIYNQKVNRYRDSLLASIAEEDIAHLFVLTDGLIEKRDFLTALELIKKRYNDPELDIHIKAVLDYSLSQAYKGLGNSEEMEYHLALSAINDITTPVREYRSLQELAAFLFEKGDIKRAYEYINCAVKDATASNARTYLPLITEILPIINTAYEERIDTKQHQQYIIFILLIAVITILVTSMLLINQQRNKVSYAKKQQSIVNEELRKVNSELQAANNQLKEINARLAEANNIKTAYVGRYMDICSDYIGKVENYRHSLFDIGIKQGTAELMRKISSSTFIEDELKDFYNSFDATFLHIYPDFVEEFNALIQPKERIILKKGKLLNSELRIFALIRLGITDSVKIAEFLRFSSSTVYNYRVKFRNAALSDRDEFEEQVSKIGHITA